MGWKIEGKTLLYCNHEMGCLKILHTEQESALSKNWKIFVGGVEKSASGEKNRINYYPFGMEQPGRSFSSDAYRYGFQGQEKDNEVKGSGNSVNFTFRMYDSRLGRFFAIDPLTADYPHYTPYSFSGNKVVAFIELEGLEEVYAQDILSTQFGKTMFDVASETSMAKEFEKALKGQTKIDVYFFVYESASATSWDNGEVEDVEYQGIDNNGRTTGSSSDGITVFYKNGTSISKITANYELMSADLDLDIVNGIIKEGKSILFIGISSAQANAMYHRSEAGEVSDDFVKNLITNGAHVLVHEAYAHGLKSIIDPNRESNPKQDHKEYHGNETMSSPGIDDKDNYKGTTMEKAVNEIKTIVKEKGL